METIFKEYSKLIDKLSSLPTFCGVSEMNELLKIAKNKAETTGITTQEALDKEIEKLLKEKK